MLECGKEKLRKDLGIKMRKELRIKMRKDERCVRIQIS